MNYEALERRLDNIEQSLSNHIIKEDEERKEMNEAIASIKTSVEGLVTAWNAMGALGTFIKWASSLAVAAYALLEIFKVK
jgi:hypothetical protein